MNLNEYADFDGLGLAELVKKREISPRELARTAKLAINTANPIVQAVVETYVEGRRVFAASGRSACPAPARAPINV